MVGSLPGARAWSCTLWDSSPPLLFSLWSVWAEEWGSKEGKMCCGAVNTRQCASVLGWTPHTHTHTHTASGDRHQPEKCFVSSWPVACSVVRAMLELIVTRRLVWAGHYVALLRCGPQNRIHIVIMNWQWIPQQGVCVCVSVHTHFHVYFSMILCVSQGKADETILYFHLWFGYECSLNGLEDPHMSGFVCVHVSPCVFAP